MLPGNNNNQLLRDGSKGASAQKLTFRRLGQPGDHKLLAEYFDHLGQDSLYSRFFGFRRFSDEEIDHYAFPDPHTEVALVAVARDEGGNERIIGEARYVLDKDNPGKAEIAISVSEDFRGQGLGRRLLAEILAIARERGVVELFSQVLASNARAIRLFMSLGFDTRVLYDQGIVHLSCRLVPPTSGDDCPVSGDASHSKPSNIDR